MKTSKLLVTTLFSLALAGTAQAQTLYFDFGTNTSVVASGYTQGYGNGTAIDGAAAANLSIDTLGLNFSNRDRGTGQFTDLTNADLLRDISYLSGMTTAQVFTFTLTGLAANAEYEIFGYSVDMFGATTNDGKTTTWTTNGGSVNHTTDSANEDLASARFQMANMTTDALGSASFTAQYVSGGPSIILWNGFDVVPVPEPSSFALLAGMFGLTWVMLRRRG